MSVRTGNRTNDDGVMGKSRTIGGQPEHWVVYWLNHFICIHGFELYQLDAIFREHLGATDLAVRAHPKNPDIIVVSSYTTNGVPDDTLDVIEYTVADIPDLNTLLSVDAGFYDGSSQGRIKNGR